ncbi:hypothetical protein PTKIN_Ptkin16aG0107000 [Pterospermum kingtungense]
MHLKVSWTLKVSIHVAVILLLCFNLKGPSFLGSKALVINGNETDRQALLQFKAKITGDQLGIMRSWNNSVHFCQWIGVKCGRRHHRVTELDLAALKLMGPISPYIGNLSFLKVLNLENNNFIHELPQEIGRLRRLEELILDRNFLAGEIPFNISGCSKLTRLLIRHNLLVGEIPAAIGHLSNLKFLLLANNTLRGTIPSLLGNLSSLEIFYLALNRLSGVIPEALGQLKNLTIFSVAVNEMSGIVPSSLFNLSNIRTLDIGENNFHGSLPSQLGHNMPYIETFSVSMNIFSGPFPISITNASNIIEIQVEGNKFSGEVSSFRKLEQLQKWRIGDNLLGIHRENDLNFLCSLANTTSLESVEMGDNSFRGILPECINNMSTAITVFNIEHNNIVGRIPAGFGNLINLEVLAFGGNQLSGTISSVIGRLQKLQFFSLDHNYISGAIPTSLGNLKMLIKLYLNDNNLQGEIPTSLGNCENLIFLDLSNNNLSGSIPFQIVRLSSLSISLFLSSNRLTGLLPFEIGYLRNLGQLDVSQNLLFGVIPNSLGNCISLEMLLMSDNFFHGPIPSSFGSLRGLVPVDGVFKNASAAFLEGVLEETGTIIAVKVLNLLSHGASRSFLAECSCSNGSLQEWLHPPIGMNDGDEAPKSLNIFRRLNVAVDVACALEYLHHLCEVPIVHCDLKPSNILLDDEMVGHVGDFGLAKFIVSKMQSNTSSLSSSLGFRGTIGYAPPEYGLGSTVTTYGDVYSYGILLLEMFTGKRPTDEMFKENLNLHNFVKTALPNRVVEITDPTLLQESLRGETMINNTFNEGSHKDYIFLWGLNSIFEIGVACSFELPTGRMNMANVVADLCSIKEKLFPTRPSRTRGTA